MSSSLMGCHVSDEYLMGQITPLNVALLNLCGPSSASFVDLVSPCDVSSGSALIILKWKAFFSIFKSLFISLAALRPYYTWVFL